MAHGLSGPLRAVASHHLTTHHRPIQDDPSALRRKRHKWPPDALERQPG